MIPKAYAWSALILAAVSAVWYFIPLDDPYGGIRILGCICLNIAFLFLAAAGLLMARTGRLAAAMPLIVLAQPAVQYHALLYRETAPFVICACSLSLLTAACIFYLRLLRRGLQNRFPES